MYTRTMSILQSIFLGILQGIAEFLPISSSGHLAIAQHLFNLKEIPLLFDVMLHLATLLAVIIYFRKKIAKLMQAFFRLFFNRKAGKSDNADSFSDSENSDGLTGNDRLSRKTIVAIIIATFITGVIGIATSKFIPEMPVKVICTGFILTALLLIISDLLQKKRSSENCAGNGDCTGISVKQAAVIGLMQGVGTLPGVSRSGSTITGALLSGVNRSDAGEFSFIVSIPAIFAAFLLEAKDLGEVASSIGFVPLLCGCVAAFVSGFAALAWLMKLIKKGRLVWFSAYLIPLGLAGLLFF